MKNKIKTKKTVAKRFKLTKKGKILRRAVGQDHFNARDKGKVTRNKRRDVGVPQVTEKLLKSLIPYAK